MLSINNQNESKMITNQEKAAILAEYPGTTWVAIDWRGQWVAFDQEPVEDIEAPYRRWNGLWSTKVEADLAFTIEQKLAPKWRPTQTPDEKQWIYQPTKIKL